MNSDDSDDDEAVKANVDFKVEQVMDAVDMKVDDEMTKDDRPCSCSRGAAGSALESDAPLADEEDASSIFLLCARSSPGPWRTVHMSRAAGRKLQKSDVVITVHSCMGSRGADQLACTTPAQSGDHPFVLSSVDD